MEEESHLLLVLIVLKFSFFSSSHHPIALSVKVPRNPPGDPHHGAAHREGFLPLSVYHGRAQAAYNEREE